MLKFWKQLIELKETKDSYIFNNGFSVNTILRIIRQYIALFNTYRIIPRDNIGIILPNGFTFIFLLIAAMFKRLNIFVFLESDNIVYIKHAILNENIKVIFSNEKNIKKIFSSGFNEDTFKDYYGLTTIIDPGIIFNGNVVKAELLYYKYLGSDNYSFINQKIKIRTEGLGQLSSIEVEKLADWFNTFRRKRENNLYSINVFEKNSFNDNSKIIDADKIYSKVTINALGFENVMKLYEEESGLSLKNSTYLLDINYAEQIPLVLYLFINSKISNEEDAEQRNVRIIDSSVFMNFWNKEILKYMNNSFFTFLFSNIYILYIWYIRRQIRKKLGKMDEYIILNPNMPYIILKLLSDTKLPFTTIWGNASTGFLNYINRYGKLHKHSGKPILELDYIDNYNLTSIISCTFKLKGIKSNNPKNYFILEKYKVINNSPFWKIWEKKQSIKSSHFVLTDNNKTFLSNRNYEVPFGFAKNMIESIYPSIVLEKMREITLSKRKRKLIAIISDNQLDNLNKSKKISYLKLRLSKDKEINKLGIKPDHIYLQDNIIKRKHIV